MSQQARERTMSGMAEVADVMKTWLARNKASADRAHMHLVRVDEEGVLLSVGGRRVRLLIPISNSEFLAYSEALDTDSVFDKNLELLNESFQRISVMNYKDAISKLPQVLYEFTHRFTTTAIMPQARATGSSHNFPLPVNPSFLAVGGSASYPIQLDDNSSYPMDGPYSSSSFDGYSNSSFIHQQMPFSHNGNVNFSHFPIIANPRGNSTYTMGRGNSNTPSMPQMKAVMKEFKALTEAIEAAKPEDFLGGVKVEIPNEQDMSVWHLRMHIDMFKMSKKLYNDLKTYATKRGDDSVLLEFRMEEHFPFDPPFVRVVRPRFAFHTGHVTIGGSVCMEVLTKSGWSPAFTIESVLVQIHNAILEGGGRLDTGNTYDYALSEAKSAFHRVARDHGWRT